MKRAYTTAATALSLVIALTNIAQAATASIPQPQSEERININTASTEELERLPGIGPALASRIIEHRSKHGRFRRPQDIIIVRGMSAKLYRRIAHLIRT